MFGYILAESEPTENLTHSFGKPYCNYFWSTNTALKLVSDDQFKRGDIVQVQNTHDPTVMIVKKLDLETLSDEDLHKVGIIAPLATDIPIMNDESYSFKTVQGDLDILTKLECVNKQNGLKSYVLLTLLKSRKAIVQGTDSNTGDQFEWMMRFDKEYDQIKSKVEKIISGR